MLSLRLVRRFRAATVLALLALVTGGAESLIADVHDGDTTLATVIAPAGAGGTAPSPEAPRPPRHSPDTPHTCHCVHAHVISLPAAETVDEALPARILQLAFRERTHASVVPDPHFRPPVA
jgi:hypothetical protein